MADSKYWINGNRSPIANLPGHFHFISTWNDLALKTGTSDGKVDGALVPCIGYLRLIDLLSYEVLLDMVQIRFNADTIE